MPKKLTYPQTRALFDLRNRYVNEWKNASHLVVPAKTMMVLERLGFVEKRTIPRRTFYDSTDFEWRAL